MKKSYSRILSLLLVAIMLLSLVLTSCHNDPSNNDDTNENTTDGGKWQMPEGEYTIPKEEG